MKQHITFREMGGIGDGLSITAIANSITSMYPDKFNIHIYKPHNKDIFKNNPNISITDTIKGKLISMCRKGMPIGRSDFIGQEIHRASQKMIALGLIDKPLDLNFRPQMFLDQPNTPIIEGDYAVVVNDGRAKHRLIDPRVINRIVDNVNIKWVQLGVAKDFHLADNAENHRKLYTMQEAANVIKFSKLYLGAFGGLSLTAQCFKKTQFVFSGGRECPNLLQDDYSNIYHSIGMLKCCQQPCGKRNTNRCYNHKRGCCNCQTREMYPVPHIIWKIKKIIG